MRLLAGAALLILSLPPAASAQDSLASATAAIDSCTLRLDPDVDIGYDRIATRCPDLARTLEHSEFQQWLPQGWKETRNNLSAGSLKELRALIGRELAIRPTTRAPRVDRLNQILAGLGDERVESGGAWARFRKWLRELLERPGAASGPGWFDRMVSRAGISDAIVEVISYVAMGAMVFLAMLVVWNELRAAGLLARRTKSESGDEKTEAPVVRPTLMLSEIERAPLPDRPRMLIELIAAKLTSLRRLPPANALTVRELTNSAELPDEADRRRLADIALTAERARYAAGGVPSAALEAAFERGRELLSTVESLPAAAPNPGNAR